MSLLRKINRPSMVFPLLSGIVLLSIPAQQVVAGCTDPARPGVDWRRCYHDDRELPGADLSGAKLRDARFSYADLTKAVFAAADARRVKFISAKLAGATFDAANLTEADFTNADASGASFRGADLRRARFYRTNLKGADLTGAATDQADLLNADLSGATWIDGKTICAEGSISQCR